jgi:hypothetical protein
MTNHIAVIPLTRKRGDTFPFAFTLTISQGVPLPITGFTFRMVADPSNAPENAANNLFDLTGVITDGPNGLVQFEPTAPDMDLTPDVYFYEVQMIDAALDIRTIVEGSFTVVQDIAK